MAAAELLSLSTFAFYGSFISCTAKQRGGDGNSSVDVLWLCKESVLWLRAFPGGFLPQTTMLPGRLMSPEMLWAVYITGVPSSAVNYGGHRVSLGAQHLNAGAWCWQGWGKPWIWVETPSQAGGAVPGVCWKLPCTPTGHRRVEGSGVPREGVWGTVHWDQYSYLCPPLKRTCPGHRSPDLQCHWAGSSPPRAFGRLVPEADGVRVSFSGVIACLAPCPGLLIPLPLLSPPSPSGGWPHCSCRATSHQLVPPLLLCPAPQGNALRVPSTQQPGCKGPPKQRLLLEMWLWPLRLQAMTVPQITPGGLPWLVGGWSSCFIRY